MTRGSVPLVPQGRTHPARILFRPGPVALASALRAALLNAGCDLWRDICCSPDSRYRQREALRQLDSHLLRDVGITRQEARLGRRLAEPEDGPCSDA